MAKAGQSPVSRRPFDFSPSLPTVPFKLCPLGNVGSFYHTSSNATLIQTEPIGTPDKRGFLSDDEEINEGRKHRKVEESTEGDAATALLSLKKEDPLFTKEGRPVLVWIFEYPLLEEEMMKVMTERDWKQYGSENETAEVEKQDLRFIEDLYTPK
jgi:hypothetical protein